MKKLLLLGSLITATAMQAQETGKTTYYWPNERVTEITDGTQYFIYNTANDGQDRSYFLYSNGSELRTNNVSPKTFTTSDASYLFTAKKPEAPIADSHWYLNCIHGIVGHGGQTNNTETRDLFISYWYGNDQILKGGAKSEDADGNLQNPNEVDTKTWAITIKPEKNPNSSDNSYAWNGNSSGAGLGNAWTRWAQAHPYAFYTISSKEISDQAISNNQEKTNRTGLISDVAFSLQKAYGLVKDGNKYYSNYPETTPAENSSYANLIDGNDNSIFHSSWSASGADTDPKHYLRAEMETPQSSFYLITKRRTSNNNNRPTNILVEGSNEENGTYTTIATLEGLPTTDTEYYYFSNKISSSTAYKYIRFTPQTINTGTRFFTYSEFYLIEANSETDDAISKIKAFYNDRSLSIKDENFETNVLSGYAAVKEVQETLNLSLYKAEARALLEANANNHAADPALGQYPTEAYNTFKTAIEKSDITAEELGTAVRTFKFSINAPVFTINGAFSGDYQTTGKSIYYKADNSANPLWWDKATNKYDKTMLWKFAGSTSTTAEVGQTYTAMNLSAEVYFWDVESLNITQTDPENQDGIVLVKTAGNNTPVHADRSGTIVRWNASAPTSASAWTITYVGESYDIEKINDEQLAAYAALKTLVAECEPYSDKIGDGLGQFTCNGYDFVQIFNEAKKAAEQDIYENADLDVIAIKENLENAKNALAINQPAAGKFYRFKSATQNNYIASNGISGRPLMTDNADEAVFYLTADSKLITSNLLAMDNYNVVANLGQATTFKASNNKIGTYVIRNNGHSYYAKATGEALDRWGNESEAINNQANCAWILEEVTDEAQQPKLSKAMTADYATLAAPVALNIPEGVKAYTVTVDVDKESAVLEEVAEVIPAGVAVVLKKEGSESSFDFTFAAEGATANSNNLVGVYTSTAIAADVNAYILGNGSNGIGFYQMNAEDRTLGANKAYLALPTSVSHIRSITIGGPTTGIEDSVAEDAQAEEYYDLQGRRVMNPTKGIYVTKNGKKVVFNK